MVYYGDPFTWIVSKPTALYIAEIFVIEVSQFADFLTKGLMPYTREERKRTPKKSLWQTQVRRPDGDCSSARVPGFREKKRREITDALQW